MTLGRPWTSCRRSCTSEQRSSGLWTVQTTTPETRGQACWSCTPPDAPQLCRGADPTLNNQTRSLHATPACCTFATLALCLLLAPLCEQQTQFSVSPLHLLLVLPTCFEFCPRAGIHKSRPWIISDQESPLPEGSVGSRTNFRKEPGRSLRDILWTTGAGPR